MTSNQVLQRAKYLYAAAKSGHTGTLDPLATGMLPICMGEATKFTSVLLKASKSYEAVIKLGYQSTTGDAEGVITKLSDAANIRLNIEDCKSMLRQFVGKIAQTPPMYSALKYQGKPLYNYARKGATVERIPRAVSIHYLQIKSLSGNELIVSVQCGTGTYIRVLAEDIGKALGCGSAYLISLRRCSVGCFHLNQVKTLGMLEEMNLMERDRCLLPIDSILHEFPSVSLDKAEAQAILCGRTVPRNNTKNPMDHTQQKNIVRLYYQQFFLGLGEVSMCQSIKPKRLLSDSYFAKQDHNLLSRIC
ncbi:tRNA pseudouridine55 synthase [Nitrosomonas sp. Nm51]|nr:tRNA pseudouridine55 synthase [Nitrosomonas sp. Nm51]